MLVDLLIVLIAVTLPAHRIAARIGVPILLCSRAIPLAQARTSYFESLRSGAGRWLSMGT
jgi:hypothetical protein